MSLLRDLITWCYSYAKIVTTKSYMQLNQCLAFEPHEAYVILAEYEMYLRSPLHFIWIKISDGYQIAGLEKSIGLCSTSQLSLWIWSFHLKNGVSFRCLLSKVISFILSYLEEQLHIFNTASLMSCWGWQLGLSGMRDRFGIFGTVTRIRNCLVLVVMLRIPNRHQHWTSLSHMSTTGFNESTIQLWAVQEWNIVKQSPFHLSILSLGVFIDFQKNHSLPLCYCGTLRSLTYLVFVDLTKAFKDWCLEKILPLKRLYLEFR